MGGFFRVDADWWPVVRERITGEWRDEEVWTDLRWWQDQVLAGREEMPGGRTLAAVWGWGHKKVRKLLDNPDRWSDPHKLDAWNELRSVSSKDGAHRGHTEGTPRAHRGHTEGTPQEGQTSTIEDEGHTEGTPRAHRGHTEGTPPMETDGPTSEMEALHNHNHNHNTQGVVPADEPPAPAAGALTPQDTASGPEPEVGPSPAQVAWDEAIRLWVKEVGPALDRPLRAPARSSSVGQKLATALKRRPEDMHDALRYVAHGDGAEDWLRGGFRLKVSIETVIRHREKYAAAWREEQETAARQPAQPTAAPRRALVAPDEPLPTPTIKPPPVRVAAK